MKQLVLPILTCLALWCAHPAVAQRDETLFSKAGRGGLFGAPITEYFDFAAGLGTATGGGGALIVGDFFFGGYGLISVDYETRLFEQQFRLLELTHAGLWIGATPMLHKVVHPFFSVKAGWGQVHAIGADSAPGSAGFVDRVFVLTPEGGLELNVFRWFRVAGTLVYRKVYDLEDGFLLRGDDLSGFGATLTLRFGFFGSNKAGRSCGRR